MTWSAKWIWFGEPKERNRYVEFRKVVERSEEELKSPHAIHVSARIEYDLRINGERVGRGPSPCTQDWQYYDTYDVTSYLKPGANVIASVCYEFGEPDIVTGQMQGDSGFLLQLESVDGGISAATDDTWRCRKSPRWRTTNKRISRWGGFNEIYLVREEDGWEHETFNDGDWSFATVIASAADAGSPWPRLLPREIPFLRSEPRYPIGIVRVEENFGAIREANRLIDGSGTGKATQLDAARAGAMPAIVYDYGKAFVGRPELAVHAPEGGVLRIAYGESLELQEVDTFILKPGKQTLTSFGRRAGRFVKITAMGTPSAISLSSFFIRHTEYPFERTSVFRSGDSVIDAIHEVSLYTTRVNSQEHTEDCPWREKALWVVDAVVMGKIIYANFADTALMRKCLLQGARIQNDDGSIPGTGPERNAMLLPDFCAYWLLGVYDYWRYSGDDSLPRELAPAIDRLMDWFEAQVDDTGLFAGADRDGWWCFIDWTDDVDRRDKVAGISFLYYKALLAYAKLGEAFGRGEQHVLAAQRRAERLKSDIRSRLWHSERGMYVDCLAGDSPSPHFSLQTQFLAAWCGLLDGLELERFLDEVYLPGTLPPVKGPFFQHIVLETLRDAGRRQQAMALIRSYWGEMLARGATTWWETFDASLPSCTIPSTYQGHTPTYLTEDIPVSLCHAWGASPGYLLNHLVFGVDVSEAGSGLIRLSPPDLEFSQADAVIPLADGSAVRIAWETRDGVSAGLIEIPDGYRAATLTRYPLEIRGAVETRYEDEAFL
ncbi:alpha-L-rhamnosidase N-terminal domain-containing protein [Cohnella ginsengisoli]|uniref:Alpha-L-rhamnosidase N-terminal domain-containing protein n=1 Tax=Cohnella ginsengisoli TaxID=425004 RepID=A0A9X4KEB1_9BACL|nr:alpha-L-rhamnosidase N-terminal domain-containing protein [Cohnella ginsengisoli]MDG0790544.1 alpha-L-rhamnosidase N-terminal domain-containing protein [Cohnella ginsengisoli]